jgi:hypothetical protein
MIARSASRTAGNLVLCGTSVALVALLLGLACGDDPAGPPSEPLDAGEIAGPAGPPTDGGSHGTLTPASLTLPFYGTVASGEPAFRVDQTGAGWSGYFSITNSSNSNAALQGLTNGRGPAVTGINVGTGHAGYFANSSNNSSATLEVRSGRGYAGSFRNLNSVSLYGALYASTRGPGPAVVAEAYGTGPAGQFLTYDPGVRPALLAVSYGSGPAASIQAANTGDGLLVNHTGSSGSLAVFQRSGANRIRFNRDGKGFFNGGTQNGGADVAEAFEVEGRVRDYEPGDVLVISTRTDRRVEISDEAYSTRVVGVVATQPGVLLTERGIDESLDDTVPVGIVGVIPTRVSAENGAIRRGDLLVTARTRGHAMRGTARDRMLGATIGKALGEFHGPGRGVILVLVNVK